MKKSEIKEIKNRIKDILSAYRIVDWNFWDCMGDVMVTVVFIHSHTVRRVSYCVRSYDGQIDQIGCVEIF